MYEDLNGQQIEVTNLDQAIKQTGLFKEYSHEGESFSEFDKSKKPTGQTCMKSL